MGNETVKNTGFVMPEEMNEWAIAALLEHV